MKLKAFHITQNETPKMEKMAVSANKLSQNCVEHTGMILRRRPFFIQGWFYLPVLLLQRERKASGSQIDGFDGWLVVVIVRGGAMGGFPIKFTGKLGRITTPEKGFTFYKLWPLESCGCNVSHGHNISHFCPSCVRLVCFLRNSTEFHVMRVEYQRILIHFLLLISHQFLVQYSGFP